MGRLELEASFEATYLGKVIEVITPEYKTLGRVESVAVEGDKLIFVLNRFGKIVRVETHITDNIITIMHHGNNDGGSDRDVLADL